MFRRAVSYSALALAALGCGSHPVRADRQEIHVFVASSLYDAMTDLANKFNSRGEGVTVTVTAAGSQELAKNIEGGAPADVFVSAGIDWMKSLQNDGFILPKTERPLASNRLCVVLPAANRAQIRTLDDLSRAGLKIVIAADVVPAGKATQAWLAKRTHDFQRRFMNNVRSQETSVRNVLNKIALDGADAGIVYDTDAIRDKEKVTKLAIPDTENDGIVYFIGPMKRAEGNIKATTFIGFVLGEDGAKELKSLGFGEALPGK